MVQSLDFIIWADNRPQEKEKIKRALASEAECEIVVDRHRVKFDPVSRMVLVDKASDDVPFAWKIAKCRMQYDLLSRLVDGQRDDMEGFEYLND